MSATTVQRLTLGNLVFAMSSVAFVVTAYVVESGVSGLFESWVPQTSGTALLAVVPFLMARRGHRTPMLWTLVVLTAVSALDMATSGLSRLGWVSTPLSASLWVPVVGLLASSVLLRFPDGRLPSPGLRRLELAAWLAVGVVATSFTLAFVANADGTEEELTSAALSGPGGLGMIVIWGTALVGLGTLVGRARRADGVELHQLRWFAFGASWFVVALVVSFTLDPNGDTFRYLSLPAVFALLGSFGVAILKHRLYDIDVVINRTVVLGGLATSITAIYVAIVVGLGSLLGDTSNLALSIGATAVVAVVFEPIRERVQHAANVLVYGERATPYEVLAGMTTSDDAAGDDPVAQAAALLGEGTGAVQVTVWTRDDAQLLPRWTWPDTLPPRAPLPITDDAVPDADLSRPLVHDGRLAGAVSLTKPRGEPVRPTDTRLLEEFAGQAAVLVANARLTEQLRQRLDQLAASRRRLVTAQDDARRRLERDVHDGAQQNLVALKVKLGLARRLALSEGVDQVADLVDAVAADADAAVDSLRSLARGIYPPLLEAEGLEAALRAQSRRSAVPVLIEAHGVTRHSREVEATVYFCVLEALQNAAKHAGADRVRVTLSQTEDTLRFEVADDGVGFEGSPNGSGTGLEGMQDRLDTLGGALVVTSTPGAGATVTGAIPLASTPEDQSPSAQAATSSSGPNSDLDTNPTAPASTAPVS